MAAGQAATDDGPGRLALAAEIFGFIALALLAKAALSLLFWRYAGPVSLLLTLLLLTLWLRKRGIGWTALGLVPLPNWKARLGVLPKAGLSLLAFAFAVFLTTIAGPAVGLDFLGEVPADARERMAVVEGNLLMYLLWMAIIWTSAAFGEEMFFRGYLITRLQALLGRGWPATLLAVIIPALIFGYGHYYYQGLRGAVVTGSIALAFGVMFLLFKRNLWPLILLHGAVDSLALTGQFAGWE